MTVKELRQYRSICVEINEINQELNGCYVGDTVQSGSKHPYNLHNVHTSFQIMI